MAIRRPWSVLAVISGTFAATLALSTFESDYVSSLNRDPASEHSEVFEVKEGERWYADKIATLQTAKPAALEKPPVGSYDLRGVGDTGWTYPGGEPDRSEVPPRLGFGEALKATDPDGKMFRGHFNFMNWESVVGENCEVIRPSVQYYFLSHPESVLAAANRGFNLFSLSNNHSQDCNFGTSISGAASKHGPLMTADSMRWISEKAEKPILWNGVGGKNTSDDPYVAKLGTFDIDGRKVRVAFASISVLMWDIPNAATVVYGRRRVEKQRVESLLKSMENADADMRILSIHTQDGSGSRREDRAFLHLKELAERFITQHNGDVVFGEGPHTWGGVRVFPKPNGKHGVVFTSLGNFLHQGLAANADNYVARALFSRDSFDLEEVQVYPFLNLKTRIAFYASAGETKEPRANFEWSRSKTTMKGKSVTGFSARFR